MILHDVIGRSPLWQVHMLGRPSIQSLRDGIRAERNETKLFFFKYKTWNQKKKKIELWSVVGAGSASTKKWKKKLVKKHISSC